jgi:hypothetical protein
MTVWASLLLGVLWALIANRSKLMDLVWEGLKAVLPI